MPQQIRDRIRVISRVAAIAIRGVMCLFRLPVGGWFVLMGLTVSSAGATWLRCAEG